MVHHTVTEHILPKGQRVCAKMQSEIKVDERNPLLQPHPKMILPPHGACHEGRGVTPMHGSKVTIYIYIFFF